MNTSKIRASQRDRNSLNWRDHLKVHPAADLFPLMSEAELRELGEDIKKNGLRNPIALWSPSLGAKTHPVLLDGRNRLDAMQLAGLEMFRADKGGRFEVTHTTLYGAGGGSGGSPVSLITGASLVVDPYEYVISANIHRRHLTAEQKREIIGKLLVADPTKSDRAIGKTVKADKNTVAKMRKQKEARGEIHHVEKRTDSKGRKQPAKKQIQPKKNTSQKPSSQGMPEVPAPPEKRTSELPTGSDSSKNHVQQATVVETQAQPVETQAQPNFLIAAWDKATSEQRHDFVLARKIEIMRAQKIGRRAFETSDDVLKVAEQIKHDDCLDIPDYLKRSAS